MICLLAEKPSVARDIAGVLGHPEKHDGYLTVGEHAVTWGFGHLVTLAEPQAYNPAWEHWSFDTLPMIPERFQLVPIAKGKAQLTIVHRLMAQADRIICATDADREGELIFRYIYRLAGVQKPVQRLWLSENTPQAIQKALAAMKPLAAYDALGKAAEARAQADWLVGLNATRAVTLRHGVPGQGALSVGRVQTPTLALIAARDAAIAAFLPVPYWQVAVMFQVPEGEYVGLWFDHTAPADNKHPDRIPQRARAQDLAYRIVAGTLGQIALVERQRITVNPPVLHSLNVLQKECYQRFGLTAQQTLDIAQHLYEQHLTSYPRTEAHAITSDVATTVAERLHGLARIPTYQPWITGLSSALPVTRLVDETQVAAAGHHAIIPTGQVPGSDSLNPQEQQVFDCIVRRFIAALMPAGVDERTTIQTQAAGEWFATKGTACVSAGWRAVLQDLPTGKPADTAASEPAPVAFPAGLQDTTAVTVTQTDMREQATQAPSRMNDASLLTRMEKHGLGTPATRARILEVLLTRGYVQRQKKALVSTAKGQALLTVVPPTLQSPEMTGQWEAQLEAIAQGSGDAAAFLQGIRQYTQALVTATQGQAAQTIGADLGACPTCHQGRIIPGKKAWGCSRWREGCRFTIWKTVAGKTLTDSQVKTLLAGKVTPEIAGFTSKAGKAFSAKLQLVDNQVQFVFDTPKKARRRA